MKIAIAGAGAAGIAIARLLLLYGAKDITLADRHGAIYPGRSHLNPEKKDIARITNIKKNRGELEDVMEGTDVFIGVSAPDIVTRSMVESMADDPIVFAMANPRPEIIPEEAAKAGARVIASGRSDYPNQLNNVLVFPGVFRGALDVRVRDITDSMLIAAAESLAKLTKKPTPKKFIADVFNTKVVKAVSSAVKSSIKS